MQHRECDKKSDQCRQYVRSVQHGGCAFVLVSMPIFSMHVVAMLAIAVELLNSCIALMLVQR
jgi:hypothetical protein